MHIMLIVCVHMAFDDDKQIIRENFWPQQARIRGEDVQNPENLSIRDCAWLGGTYGKFACFCSREGYSQNHSTHLRLARVSGKSSG